MCIRDRCRSAKPREPFAKRAKRWKKYCDQLRHRQDGTERQRNHEKSPLEAIAGNADEVRGKRHRLFRRKLVEAEPIIVHEPDLHEAGGEVVNIDVYKRQPMH